MKQFRALVCNNNKVLSLPLLAAYLDEHTLPAEIGALTLPNLVDREHIAKDPEHPRYYFCTALSPGLFPGVVANANVYGLLINLLAAGGPGATL